VSSSGISKSAPCSRCQHASTPTLSFFTGRTPFLPPNQQPQSTEDNKSTSRPQFKNVFASIALSSLEFSIGILSVCACMHRCAHFPYVYASIDCERVLFYGCVWTQKVVGYYWANFGRLLGGNVLATLSSVASVEFIDVVASCAALISRGVMRPNDAVLQCVIALRRHGQCIAVIAQILNAVWQGWLPGRAIECLSRDMLSHFTGSTGTMKYSLLIFRRLIEYLLIS